MAENLAIVLDRGVRGNAIDFLAPNIEFAYNNVVEVVLLMMY